MRSEPARTGELRKGKPMTNGGFTDPLSVDITEDLKRVDRVVTQILRDRAVWDEFLRDPNGVLVRLGLHPPTTAEINERANGLFYAALTNKELVRLIINHFNDFRPSRSTDFRDEFLANLRKGEIQYNVELDLEAAYHAFQSPAFLRQVLSLTFHDLNAKGLFQRRYTSKEIDDYIERVVVAVEARQPIEAHPTLEVWDRNYGVGERFGSVVVEVNVIATASGIVEAAVFVTAFAFVIAVVAVAGAPPDIMVQLTESAAAGDEESIRALAIFARLLDLSADLLVHVHTFESTRRPS
jgi:hypothetical protein